MIDKNFWNRKKVLVTGHTGFKGGWLSLWLKSFGAKIIGYSLNPITKKNFFNSTKLKTIFLKDFRKNIKSLKDLTHCIDSTKPQIIFHLAAQPQVLESYKQPLDTVNTNVVGTANLLEIVRKRKFVKVVIIITTDKVYKNLNKKKKFRENSILGGDDVYSASKASADIISLSYSKSFFNRNSSLATARAGNCIGGGDWTKFRILTDSVNAFYNKRKLILRNPTYKRPWQHVFEPLAGYIILAQKMYKRKGTSFSGAWNFGPSGKNHLTVYQFAKLFKKKMKSNSKIVLLNMKDNREKTTLDLSSTKAKKFLKWKPFLNINKTLSLTAEWYLANKAKKNMLNFSLNQLSSYTVLVNKSKKK